MATHSAEVRRERVYVAPPSRAIQPIRYASLERTGYETVMARRQMRARPAILGALRGIGSGTSLVSQASITRGQVVGDHHTDFGGDSAKSGVISGLMHFRGQVGV